MIRTQKLNQFKNETFDIHKTLIIYYIKIFIGTHASVMTNEACMMIHGRRNRKHK